MRLSPRYVMVTCFTHGDGIEGSVEQNALERGGFGVIADPPMRVAARMYKLFKT